MSKTVKICTLSLSDKTYGYKEVLWENSIYDKEMGIFKVPFISIILLL